MKRLFRDTCILFGTVTGMAWLYRAYVRTRGPLVRVVVFHDVPGIVWFESMIATLKNTYNVLSPEDFYAGTLDIKKINVLVTFDDGYQSWVDVALPILEKYGVKGIFFINSGLVDVAENSPAVDMFMKENLRITPRHALSWKGVGALVSGKQIVGGHTRIHANLTLLQNIELDHEIIDDKRVLEEQLSQIVSDFAYPFGTHRHINAEVIDAVRGAGYTHAYTAISRFVSQREAFMIPRMCIETGLSPKKLRRWVEGAYDLFDIIKNICTR